MWYSECMKVMHVSQNKNNKKPMTVQGSPHSASTCGLAKHGVKILISRQSMGYDITAAKLMKKPMLLKSHSQIPPLYMGNSLMTLKHFFGCADLAVM